MGVNYNPLIDALRSELLEYGGLLKLLKEHRFAITGGNPNALLAAQDAIALQLETINLCGTRREERVTEIATAIGQKPDSPLRRLIENCAEPLRPLLYALTDEVNQLILRTRLLEQQNQMLLACMVF